MHSIIIFFIRLRRKSNRITQLRLQYPTAPVLSQKLERSCSKNEDLLPIIVQIGESRSTMLHCTCTEYYVMFSKIFNVYMHVRMWNADKSKVGSVITKAVEKIHDTCKLSQGFIFKVCGREEYFEKWVHYWGHYTFKITVALWFI